MKEILLKEIEPGVLMIQSGGAGPKIITFEGINYYRFMDFFYIQNNNLDSLTPQEVSNLCRARAKFPELITYVNKNVRRVFKLLVQALNPGNLLEIGAGKNPIFASDDTKPNCYILADADREVVNYHNSRNNSCYMFSEEFCEVPHIKNSFDMVIAVFVLHFPFQSNQIAEIEKRLKINGTIVANVYRRNFKSRENLTIDLEGAGFKILKVADKGNLCRDHEYWVIGKDESTMAVCARTLQGII